MVTVLYLIHGHCTVLDTWSLYLFVGDLIHLLHTPPGPAQRGAIKVSRGCSTQTDRHLKKSVLQLWHANKVTEEEHYQNQGPTWVLTIHQDLLCKLEPSAY